MATSVMWFRRDLRLSDNPALVEAVADASRGEGVVALFCLDDRLVRSSGAPREVFLYRCLRALDESIGGRLVVRRGDPAEVVPAIAAEAGAERVHAAADFGPYGAARDDLVERKLADADVELRLVGSPYAVAPGTVLNAAGGAVQGVHALLAGLASQSDGTAPLRAPAAVRWVEVAERIGIPKATGVSTPTLPVAGRGGGQASGPPVLGPARSPTTTDPRNCPEPTPRRRLSPLPEVGHASTLASCSRSSELEGPWHVPHRAVLAGVLRRRALPPTRHGPAGLQPAMRMRVDAGAGADERFRGLGRGPHRVIRSSTPGCASCWPRRGCTTGCAWSSPASW